MALLFGACSVRGMQKSGSLYCSAVEMYARFEKFSASPCCSSRLASVVSISECGDVLSRNTHVCDAHSSLCATQRGDRFISSYSARDNKDSDLLSQAHGAGSLSMLPSSLGRRAEALAGLRRVACVSQYCLFGDAPSDSLPSASCARIFSEETPRSSENPVAFPNLLFAICSKAGCAVVCADPGDVAVLFGAFSGRGAQKRGGIRCSVVERCARFETISARAECNSSLAGAGAVSEGNASGSDSLSAVARVLDLCPKLGSTKDRACFVSARASVGGCHSNLGAHAKGSESFGCGCCCDNAHSKTGACVHCSVFLIEELRGSGHSPVLLQAAHGAILFHVDSWVRGDGAVCISRLAVSSTLLARPFSPRFIASSAAWLLRAKKFAALI
jgi:hypothetical protein